MTGTATRKPHERIFELAARVPWWGYLIALVVTYPLFHWLSEPVTSGSVGARYTSNFGVGAVIRQVAHVALNVVPIFCVAAAMASALYRGRPKPIALDTAASAGPGKLLALGDARFDQLLADAFRLDGFLVTGRGSTAPDGQVHQVLWRGEEKFLVDSRHWREARVSGAVVRRVFAAITATNAAGGLVVTSGTFTEDAVEYAEGRSVILVDGKILLDMIERAERAPGGNHSAEVRV